MSLLQMSFAGAVMILAIMRPSLTGRTSTSYSASGIWIRGQRPIRKPSICFPAFLFAAAVALA